MGKDGPDKVVKRISMALSVLIDHDPPEGREAKARSRKIAKDWRRVRNRFEKGGRVVRWQGCEVKGGTRERRKGKESCAEKEDGRWKGEGEKSEEETEKMEQQQYALQGLFP